MTKITEFPSREALYENASKTIGDILNSTLIEAGSVTLLLSGGSTPSPVYQRLSTVFLPWEKVQVGLVDERWVPLTSPGSNEALIRSSLMTNNAANAELVSMVSDDASVFGGWTKIENTYKRFSAPDIVILGMGPDGHCASWFPGSKGLETAMSPHTANVTAPIDATGCPVAGDYHERITITLPVLMRARHVILLITGDEKKAVLNERSKQLPIHKAIEVCQDMTVFWAP